MVPNYIFTLGEEVFACWMISVIFIDVMNSCTMFFTFSVIRLIYFRAIERCTENVNLSFGVAAFRSFCNYFQTWTEATVCLSS